MREREKHGWTPTVHSTRQTKNTGAEIKTQKRTTIAETAQHHFGSQIAPVSIHLNNSAGKSENKPAPEQHLRLTKSIGLTYVTPSLRPHHRRRRLNRPVNWNWITIVAGKHKAAATQTYIIASSITIFTDSSWTWKTSQHRRTKHDTIHLSATAMAPSTIGAISPDYT